MCITLVPSLRSLCCDLYIHGRFHEAEILFNLVSKALPLEWRHGKKAVPGGASQKPIWEPWGKEKRVALSHCQASGPQQAGTLHVCLLVLEPFSTVSWASSQRPGRADLRFQPEVGCDGSAATMEVSKWHKSRLPPQTARCSTLTSTPLPLTQKEMQFPLERG